MPLVGLGNLAEEVASIAHRRHGWTGRRIARPAARPFLKMTLRHCLAHLPEKIPQTHTQANTDYLEAVSDSIEQASDGNTRLAESFSPTLLILLLQILLPVILRAFLEWLNNRTENERDARDLAARLAAGNA